MSKEIKKKFICGLDLGQKKDYTAFVALEAITDHIVTPDPEEYHRIGDLAFKDSIKKFKLEYIISALNVKEIIRFPIGTQYTKIVDFVIEYLRILKSDVKQIPDLVVDATNNTAFVDFIKERRIEKYIELFYIYPMTITAGGAVIEEENALKVPKRDLITKINIAMEKDLLCFANGLEYLDVLVSELEDYHVEVTQSSNEIYNARSGAHDDLVLALSMAVWLGVKEGFYNYLYSMVPAAIRSDIKATNI